MSDLKPHRVLRRECLDERRYFDALLSVSLDHGLLTQNDLLRMQGEFLVLLDRKSTRLNSSHSDRSRMPSSA